VTATAHSNPSSPIQSRGPAGRGQMRSPAEARFPRKVGPRRDQGDAGATTAVSDVGTITS
jgi:hypothetical protein